MNLVFIGPPGAGKGTQTKRLVEERNMISLATGDILRQNVQENTALGQRAKVFMDEGKLVPDHVITDMIGDTLDGISKDKDIIFDGYPRNSDQLKALEELLVNRGQAINYVIEICVDEEKLVERITGRFTCKACQASYHDKFRQTKVEGKCDYCGGTEFVRREDDTAEKIKQRLSIYNQEKEAIIGYYKAKDLLYQINGMNDQSVVANEISDILNGYDLTNSKLRV